MNLDVILNVMSKWHLTADETLLVYLTFIAQRDNGDPEKHKTYFKQWYEDGGKKQLKSLFESLKSKGVIRKNYNPDYYDPDEIEFNQNFINQYFKLTGELGKELLHAYPTNITINGKVVSLKNISKHFASFDDLYFRYASEIGHNIDKHRKILEILEWAKQNDLIHVPLTEFIISRKWQEFEEMKTNGILGQASTYDIFKDS